MEIHMAQGVVRITCGGRPLDGPYLPPKAELRALGQYLAKKYGNKNEKKENETYECEKQHPGDPFGQIDAGAAAYYPVLDERLSAAWSGNRL